MIACVFTGGMKRTPSPVPKSWPTVFSFTRFQACRSSGGRLGGRAGAQMRCPSWQASCRLKCINSGNLNCSIGKTRAAKGRRLDRERRIYYEFRSCMVPTRASLILIARARAKVLVEGQTALSKSACWQGLEAANRSFAAKLSECTAIGVSPCPRPASLPSCFQLKGRMPALFDRTAELEAEKKQQRCPTLLRDWTLRDLDWFKIGRRSGGPKAKPQILIFFLQAQLCRQRGNGWVSLGTRVELQFHLLGMAGQHVLVDILGLVATLAVEFDGHGPNNHMRWGLCSHHPKGVSGQLVKHAQAILARPGWRPPLFRTFVLAEQPFEDGLELSQRMAS